MLALHTQHYVMLQRNLLYTAVSRAKRLVVIVGNPAGAGGGDPERSARRALQRSGGAAARPRSRRAAPRHPSPDDAPDITVIEDLDALRAYFAS